MTDRTPTSSGGRPTRRAPFVAALLTLLEGLVLLGFAAFYAYELSIGATDSPTRAITSGVLILTFGVFLLVMARGWARGATWPRTPTLLWNVLLLPVAWSLYDARQLWIAVGVAAAAIPSIVAAIMSPARQRAGAEDSA